MSAAATSHWSAAAAHWDAIGPPLRPTADDVDAVRLVAEGLAPARRRILVLGATRELGGAPWPKGTTLLAVDRSAPMLRRLWTGPAGTAVLGEWTALPLADATVDLAVCDGGWHLLDRPRGQERFAGELARVTAPGGRLAVRLFEPASDTWSVDAVLGLLDAGEVVDANHLKVLLWMAVRDSGDRVAVADVWDALAATRPDLDLVADERGWPRATLRAFETYRGSPDRYDLLGSRELDRQLAATGAFERVGGHVGAVLAPGLRFPTVIYERLA